jgi:uncharacterized protein YlaN (UPF0358 family)
MPRKLPNLVLLFIFFMVIAAPLVSLPSVLSGFLKRSGIPQQRDSLTNVAKAVIDFPSEFSAYFEDHYLLHQQLVDMLINFRFHFLHETDFPNVLIGKEDWLYYTGENNIADFECASPFTAGELQKISSRLLEWDAELSDRGIKFYVVFAPNKESIYPQYLPDNVKAGSESCRIDQVMSKLASTPLSVLDLRDSLKAEARQRQVYHRTDTHWNATGALHASREILSLIKVDFPQLTIPSFEDYQEDLQPFSGDLAAFLPYDKRFVERSISLLPLTPNRAELDQAANRMIISSIPDSPLPGALIFRDSFSNAIIPFLSEHFSRVVYAHSFSVDLDLVDNENPDIVIFELAQRYLTVLR